MKELKKMLFEFTDLFSNSLCVICLLLSGFLIFINVYHYKEIRYNIRNDYLLDEVLNEDVDKIKKLKEKIENVRDV